MLKILIAMMTLLLVVVNCQPQKPTDTGLVRERGTAVGLEHDVGRLSRRLAAYNINTDDDDDDDDDARWLLMAVAAAAAGVTSLMTMFALCTCCRRKHHR